MERGTDCSQILLSTNATQNVAVGGRLQHFYEAWGLQGLDPWASQVVREGYRIPFSCSPPLSAQPVSFTTYQKGSPRFLALKDAIEEMIQKEAVESIPLDKMSAGFYSRMFVVPKSSGSWRPIIDLSPLNKMITLTKFRMETPQSVLASLSKNDWMTSIDLKDAYFHVPIHKKSRRYLRFAWENQVLQFRALCFGLCTAPQVFTRMMGVVATLCHQQGIRLHRYLDDWLIVAKSANQTHTDTQQVIEIAERLGLLINIQKSDLIPSQKIIYLGMEIDTLLGIVCPAPKRVTRLLEIVQIFRDSDHLPAWEWLRLIGHLVSLEKLVPWGRMHLRSLQYHLRKHWTQDMDAKSTMVPMSNEVILDLIWWVDPSNLLAGSPLSQTQPDLQLFTDASSQGWGAHLLHLQASGLWSPVEASQHINLLELQAVRLGLQAFLSTCRDKTVLVMSDNATVVSYIKNQGGTKSWNLCQRTLDLLKWSLEQNISLRSRYIPGQQNVIADLLSRKGQVLPAEWSLHPAICSHIWKVWGSPHIDLFATKFNNKLPTYCSPVQDPAAWATDSMSIPWHNLYAYAFPPPALVGKVLAKLTQSQNTRIILIAPLWPQQPWFAEILFLAIDHPRKLPLWKKLLKQPFLNKFHPNPELFQYHAWILSSKELEPEDFRQRQPLEWQDPTDGLPSLCTKQNGHNFVIGAVRGRKILSKPLFQI